VAAQPAGSAQGGIARGHRRRVAQGVLDPIAGKEAGACGGAEDVAAAGGVDGVDLGGGDQCRPCGEAAPR
jgi:hypothetical protein